MGATYSTPLGRTKALTRVVSNQLRYQMNAHHMTLHSVAGSPRGNPPRKGDADGELVMPIPDDAPARPTNHSKLGKPKAGWGYRDANGELLFLTYQFDRLDQGKVFVPLSLCG
jgi:hypothetical protein